MKEKRTWLDWAREIQGLAQTGLTYSTSDRDTECYRRLIQIAAEMVGRHSGCDENLLTEDFLWQPGYATPKVDVRGAIGFTRRPVRAGRKPGARRPGLPMRASTGLGRG